jgi:hypothetical protein
MTASMRSLTSPRFDAIATPGTAPSDTDGTANILHQVLSDKVVTAEGKPDPVLVHSVGTASAAMAPGAVLLQADDDARQHAGVQIEERTLLAPGIAAANAQTVCGQERITASSVGNADEREAQQEGARSLTPSTISHASLPPPPKHGNGAIENRTWGVGGGNAMQEPMQSSAQQSNRSRSRYSQHPAGSDGESTGAADEGEEGDLSAMQAEHLASFAPAEAGDSAADPDVSPRALPSPPAEPPFGDSSGHIDEQPEPETPARVQAASRQHSEARMRSNAAYTSGANTPEAIVQLQTHLRQVWAESPPASHCVARSCQTIDNAC